MNKQARRLANTTVAPAAGAVRGKRDYSSDNAEFQLYNGRISAGSKG